MLKPYDGNGAEQFKIIEKLAEALNIKPGNKKGLKMVQELSKLSKKYKKLSECCNAEMQEGNNQCVACGACGLCGGLCEHYDISPSDIIRQREEDKLND